MFITLLVATFVVALVVAFIVERLFNKPIAGILQRLIKEDIYRSWKRYIMFALYVVGISSGVRIWDLEKYINPSRYNDSAAITLNLERWVLEIYRTIIGTLQGMAWMLLVFFMVALGAYILLKIIEVTRGDKAVEGK